VVVDVWTVKKKVGEEEEVVTKKQKHHKVICSCQRGNVATHRSSQSHRHHNSSRRRMPLSIRFDENDIMIMLGGEIPCLMRTNDYSKKCTDLGSYNRS
jgi:hypothetical protein